jgi:hypothetical protein
MQTQAGPGQPQTTAQDPIDGSAAGPKPAARRAEQREERTGDEGRGQADPTNLTVPAITIMLRVMGWVRLEIPMQLTVRVCTWNGLSMRAHTGMR